jgi:hypothetical protein
MRSVVIHTIHQISYYSEQVKDDEMDRTCIVHKTKEKNSVALVRK